MMVEINTWPQQLLLSATTAEKGNAGRAAALSPVGTASSGAAVTGKGQEYWRQDSKHCQEVAFALQDHLSQRRCDCSEQGGCRAGGDQFFS